MERNMDRKRRSAKSCVLSNASVCRRRSPSFPACCGQRSPHDAKSRERRPPGFSSIVRRRHAPTAPAVGSGRIHGAGPGCCRGSARGAMIPGQASLSSAQNDCTRAPDRAVRRRVRWCSFDMFASPRSRDAAAGSACAEAPTRFSFRSKFAGVRPRRAVLYPPAVRQTVRSAATSLPRWISGATIKIRGQRFEPSCGCPDPGALRMLDQPSNQSQDNSLPAAERLSAAGDQSAIVHDAFSLQDSCNVVEQKMLVLRTGGSRRPQ